MYMALFFMVENTNKEKADIGIIVRRWMVENTYKDDQQSYCTISASEYIIWCCISTRERVLFVKNEII